MEKRKIPAGWKWALAVFVSAAIYALSAASMVQADGGDATQNEGKEKIIRNKVEDFDPIGGVVTKQITLDTLGDVNLVSFYYNDLHPTLKVVLADDGGSILYELCGMNGMEIRVFDVFVEDMDGDGRDDIKVILGMEEEGWSPYRLVWNHYQAEDGGFSRVTGSGIPKESVQMPLHEYYGCYRIVEACPLQDFTTGGNGLMTEQELDMMLGRPVILDKGLMVLHDCEKKQGIVKGGDMFSGNHMVQVSVLAGMEGHTATPDCTLDGMVPDHAMEQAVGKERYEKINGTIENSENETIRLYTMEGTDSLIMSSYLSGQYFILEKLEGREAKKVREDASWKEGGMDAGKIWGEEKEAVLEDVYGTYTVKEFLPTRYYGGTGDPFLPGGEPGWMEGKKISIGEDAFTTYDNYRWSDAGRDRETGKWFQKAEIQEPEYRLTRRKDWEIFGLKDGGMLPEGMRQGEYMEIDVYPGLRLGNDRYLPQLFLLDDGRILMYSMGQYFLLEKDG